MGLKDFRNIELSDKVFPYTNKNNYESFRKAQEEMDVRYRKVEQERMRKERVRNLRKWDESLPQRWRGASLSKIDNDGAREILHIIREDGRKSLFLSGSAGSGKTYMAYATVRNYLGAGLATVSQVKIISEDVLLGYAHTGFEGRKKLEEMLNKGYKIFLLDNMGDQDFYDVKRERPVIERMIDHIYSNSLVGIFTSNDTAENFAEILSESGKAKLSSLVSGRTIMLGERPVPKLSGDSKKYNRDIDDDTLNLFNN